MLFITGQCECKKTLRLVFSPYFQEGSGNDGEFEEDGEEEEEEEEVDESVIANLQAL
jgi:hypothetical protein